MKSSLKKLRGFTRHMNDGKEKRHRQPAAQLDELAQASQDMEDMRNCYDSLLSAAAATANSAYEFSESLREMGSCLLEKTALNKDEDGDRVLLMLGRVQFELQKLVDSYRSHIFKTITTPSESLLNELRTVEEMKRHCDEKRVLYEHMMTVQKEKGKSRSTKGESFTSQESQAILEQYDEEATLFVFRLKSLKQGQSRSLLIQAARHHAAQLNFFKKGLKSLEAVEAHIKLVIEQQHIDCQFSGLEDDDAEEGCDDDDDYHNNNDVGELSFDYGQNDQGPEVVSTSRNSMELDQVDLSSALVSTMETAQEDLDNNQRDLYTFARGHRAGSQSAPLFPEKKFDPTEKMREMCPPSTRKVHTYVLPTPIDAKNSTITGSSHPVPSTRTASMSGRTHNLWYSSPLEPKNHVNRDSDAIEFSSTQKVLKESNINDPSTRVPPPLADGLLQPQYDPRTVSDTKKIKRYAFSGPITSKTYSSKPIASTSSSIASVEQPRLVSEMLARPPIPQPSSSPKVSPSASPRLMPPPKISELHELPRPPASLVKLMKPPSLIAHSAPLLPKCKDLSATSKMPLTVPHAAAPLPTPPGAVARSFSIPSSGQRAMNLPVTRLVEAPQNPHMTEEAASPPLTPISLTILQSSSASEPATRARRTRGED